MNKIIQIGNIVNTGNFNNPQRGRVYSVKGLCPALNTCSGGGLEPKIIDPTVCEERKDEGLRFFKDNVCGALRTKDSCGDKRVIEPKVITYNIKQQVTVRKYSVDTDRLKTVLKDSKNNSKLSCNDIAQKLNVPLTNVEHWFRSDNCFSIPQSNIWFKLKDLLNIKDDSFDKSITEFEVVDGKFDMADRVYDSQGISHTLTATGEHRIVDKPTAAAMRGRQNGQQLEISDRKYSNALTTVQKDSLVNCDFRIRKLTPKECWRLMGFTDEDFEKAKAAGISNSQLYKQAGNSIVVNCLEAIFKELLRGTEK